MKNSKYLRYFWGFMACYLLNLSIDTVNPKPSFIQEDLSFNEQESILELVVEKVLGFDDAFKECNDLDTEDHPKKSSTKLDFTVHQYTASDFNESVVTCREQIFCDKNSFLVKGFLKLDLPPPKIHLFYC